LLLLLLLLLLLGRVRLGGEVKGVDTAVAASAVAELPMLFEQIRVF